MENYIHTTETLEVEAMGTGTDANGIKMLYETADSSMTWDSSSWNNGNERILGVRQTDPDDPKKWFRPAGSQKIRIDGRGHAIPIGGDPHLYISNRHYFNVEFTAYFERGEDDGVADGGLSMGVRSGSHSKGACAHTYYSRFSNNGRHDFVKELAHPKTASGGPGSTDLRFSGALPRAHWIGQKFVCYTQSNGDVVLESYIDETEGRNGGDWKLVKRYVDAGGWPSESTCIGGNNRITQEGFVFCRNSGHKSSRYKWMSCREIKQP
jgi:hypothetical protein